MNERLENLFEQAFEYARTESDVRSNRAVVEKFAELIVRECAGVCDDERDSTDSDFGKLVAESCALKIMERFGVVE